MPEEVELVRSEITRKVCASDGPSLNIWTVNVDNVRVCLICGAFVPRYTAAIHVNYHRERGDV